MIHLLALYPDINKIAFNTMTQPLLMITELFLPTKGGTAVSFDDDFRRLGGKDVHIVTADVPGAKEFDLEHPNSVYRLSLKRCAWVRPESLLMYLNLFQKSLWLTLSKRVTAIFAGRALPEGFIALLIGKLTRRNVLIYAHGEELTGWGRGKKFQAMCFTLQHANWILANSEDTRDTLINLIGVAAERIVITLPTVDETRFFPAIDKHNVRDAFGISNDKKLILSVGRLMQRKGFDNTIRTLPLLIEQGLDVAYALIGTGEEQEALQQLAQELNVTDRVHFLGHVSYEDLPRWYNSCDLFAMPNRDINGDNEGFGLVFLEAASSGKPAISGLAGGTGSAVVDGETGLRVEGESILEITKGISFLLRNPEKAQEMGDKARARVLNNFTHIRRIKQIRAHLVKKQ